MYIYIHTYIYITFGWMVSSQADISGNFLKKSFHARSASFGSYFLFGSLDSGISIFWTRSRRSAAGYNKLVASPSSHLQ